MYLCIGVKSRQFTNCKFECRAITERLETTGFLTTNFKVGKCENQLTRAEGEHKITILTMENYLSTRKLKGKNWKTQFF